ncbi:hypothetical protein [Streptomyces bambusae]|uniref:Uncharacterized protein n=1 Tax=Streptomyces bambusae TaxID=1550616 RepID=A0ABS6Z6P3_9ACTN|nr:hypothetical protein [Streptomyces bambusae]MBW5482360.1 hypothetical protein [Streptomyces bambusae]
MSIFRRSFDEQGDHVVEEMSLLRSEFGQELRSGLSELRSMNADLRQHLGSSLESGLQDLRDELRELRRELNDAHKTITEARRESEALRLELETARRVAAEQRTVAFSGTADAANPPSSASGSESRPLTESSPSASEAETKSDQFEERHAPDRTSDAEWTLDAVLEKAAGVSAADLICHRDAWAFIVEQGARNAHFRVPGLATNGDDDEQTKVTISGRTLIAILSALHAAQDLHATSREDRALASTYYRRIAGVITEALPSQGDAARTRIVIDDRS